MSVSGVTLSPLLANLLRNSGIETASTTTSETPATTASGLDSSPAYLLSLGQQQSGTALLGYGNLGKLVRQVDTSLAAMDQNNPAVIARIGGGALMQESHTLDVRQLAQAQVLTSGEYASASQTMAGTGTLAIQGGSYDPETQTFMANADSVTIEITDGSLNGIADAINAADIGLTASVIEGADGGYRLQVAGLTGADNAFQLSGVAGLTYDPSAPSAGSLQATQSATDALYTVDGGPLQSSWTNAGVAVTSTITATLTATGPMTVSVPFGFAQASGAAQTLVNAVNVLLVGLGGLTGSGDALAGDTGPASQLGDAISQALSQVTGGSGDLSNLSDIGITVQSDGTLAVDATKLQSAYSSDPAATRDLLDQAAEAVRQVLSGSGGASDQIQSQLGTLVQTMLAQMPSLTDILNQADSGSSQIDGLFGVSTQDDPLLAALQGGSGLAAVLGQGDQNSSLLSAFGSGAYDSQNDALVQALTEALAADPNVQS